MRLVGPRSLAAERERAGADPAGYLADVCARIVGVDPQLSAFVPDTVDPARVQAAAAAAPDGPLRGVALAVKDVIAVDGIPLRAGSALPPDRLARPEASVVSRLRAAGAVVVGMTVTAEFAFFAPGPARNPWAPEHTPGGSSSGSAAAVAAGLVPRALGTQTIGSVIRPAAYCGVVGFRPTTGRVPSDGVIPFAPSLDTVGWFTATVADAAAVAAVAVPGWRPGAERRRPVLGVPADAYLALAEPAARVAFAEQLDRLRAAGCTVRSGALFADAAELADALFTISRFEFAQTHREWFDEFGDRYQAKTAEAVRAGRAITPDEYAAALEAQRRARDAYAELTAGIDLWVTPGATGPAPHGLATTGDPAMSSPFSLVGAPAVNIPAGTDPSGLPLGMQCAAALDADEQLFADAAEIETVLRRP